MGAYNIPSPPHLWSEWPWSLLSRGQDILKVPSVFSNSALLCFPLTTQILFQDRHGKLRALLIQTAACYRSHPTFSCPSPVTVMLLKAFPFNSQRSRWDIFLSVIFVLNQYSVLDFFSLRCYLWRLSKGQRVSPIDYQVLPWHCA